MTNTPKTGRSTPPNDDEWPWIWKALENSDKSWVIVGPIWSVVSNWKALCVLFAVVAFIKGDELTAILRGVLGVVQ